MIELESSSVNAVNIALLVFCSVEAIIVLLNYPRVVLKSRASKIFFIQIIAIAFTMTCYAVSIIIDPGLKNYLSMILMSLAYFGLYAIIFMFLGYVRIRINEVERDEPVSMAVVYIGLVVASIGSMLWILALFDEQFRIFNDTDSPITVQLFVGVFGAIVLNLIILYLLGKYHGSLGNRETAVLSSLPLLFLLATFMEPFSQGIELHYPAVSIGFVIVYTQHHMDLETRYDMEEAERLKNRVAMATGRIKPHYLYNVLTSIYYLCETDSAKAQYAIGTFSEYLRSALESMERGGLVDFTWELGEIRNYLTLERLRFGDRIKVVYDIEHEDFKIPPLCVQPLVENAVRHGLSPKEEGGTVTISTRKLSDGGTQITVTDDGVGFNVEQLKTQEVTREGVVNVRERIAMEVGGELTITSAPGKGTTAAITIRSSKQDYR